VKNTGLMGIDNNVLREILEPNMEEVTGDGRK
jgi:hypothetical protein